MSGKCVKYIQKKFCCLKIIICTHSCTRLWHQGIIAISCRIWKQKFRFLEKKMCLMYYNQFLFANLLKSILLSHVYNIKWFVHTRHTIFYIFCGYRKKWEKSKFGWIHNGIWKKKCAQIMLYCICETTKTFLANL